MTKEEDRYIEGQYTFVKDMDHEIVVSFIPLKNIKSVLFTGLIFLTINNFVKANILMNITAIIITGLSIVYIDGENLNIYIIKAIIQIFINDKKIYYDKYDDKKYDVVINDQNYLYGIFVPKYYIEKKTKDIVITEKIKIDVYLNDEEGAKRLFKNISFDLKPKIINKKVYVDIPNIEIPNKTNNFKLNINENILCIKTRKGRNEKKK